MEPLRDVGDALFVLHVKRRDAFAVLVRQPVGGRRVRDKTIAACVEHDDIGNSKRAFGLGAQCIAFFDILEIAF